MGMPKSAKSQFCEGTLHELTHTLAHCVPSMNLRGASKALGAMSHELSSDMGHTAPFTPVTHLQRSALMACGSLTLLGKNGSNFVSVSGSS
eukprot:scaffold2134_cov384-Prasinococcus_capsulatus_cf.AAC.3